MLGQQLVKASQRPNHASEQTAALEAVQTVSHIEARTEVGTLVTGVPIAQEKKSTAKRVIDVRAIMVFVCV